MEPPTKAPFNKGRNTTEKAGVSPTVIILGIILALIAAGLAYYFRKPIQEYLARKKEEEAKAEAAKSGGAAKTEADKKEADKKDADKKDADKKDADKKDAEKKDEKTPLKPKSSKEKKPSKTKIKKKSRENLAGEEQAEGGQVDPWINPDEQEQQEGMEQTQQTKHARPKRRRRSEIDANIADQPPTEEYEGDTGTAAGMGSNRAMSMDALQVPKE